MDFERRVRERTDGLLEQRLEEQRKQIAWQQRIEDLRARRVAEGERVFAELCVADRVRVLETEARRAFGEPPERERNPAQIRSTDAAIEIEAAAGVRLYSDEYASFYVSAWRLAVKYSTLSGELSVGRISKPANRWTRDEFELALLAALPEISL